MAALTKAMMLFSILDAALAGHCRSSTVPNYCCSIGCDSVHDTSGGCTGAPGEVTLADIFAIASSGGCSPLTEGSCSYGPSNAAACQNSGFCGPSGCTTGVASSNPAPSPPLPPVAAAVVAGDPHFHTAHGDRFDFRGKDKTLYNVLSHANVSVNAYFENVDYREGGQKQRLVHGTYVRALYATYAAPSGRSVRVEYAARAAKFVRFTLVDAAGEDMEERRVRLTTGWSVALEGCVLGFDGRALSITTPEWVIGASNKVKPGIVGASTCATGKCFLEVSATPRFDADKAKVAPHGLIGQSYDGDNFGVVGNTDSYETRANEVTTAAMGEGAIEGVAADYEMASNFATAFKYSRFGLKTAPPRDVSALAGKKVRRVDTVAKTSE